MDNSILLTHHASWVLTVFVIGYVLIILEEFARLNKAVSALLMGVACWVILFMEPGESVTRHLETLGIQMFKVSQVLFFLLGALTIVAVIHSHQAFKIITERLSVSSKQKLLWSVAWSTFFLSSILDNLTTTIVMVSLMHRLLEDRSDRLMIGGMIVIAANAGGAWTPIGDVATTLLWINGQISTFVIMRDVFFPSVACLLVPLIWMGSDFKGELNLKIEDPESVQQEPNARVVLFWGIGLLIFVPIFKAMTDLPPFMGMTLGVAIIWAVTDYLHLRFPEKHYLLVPSILSKVDMTVIYFYLGILLSINALESAGWLRTWAGWLNVHIPNASVVAIIIGLVSSIVDNVSLVAATIGMYPLSQFPQDSSFWKLLTYCAGTGGSILIIGSAAGVAFMALEKVDFLWYAKKIFPKALAGYAAGVLVYMLLETIV